MIHEAVLYRRGKKYVARPGTKILNKTLAVKNVICINGKTIKKCNISVARGKILLFVKCNLYRVDFPELQNVIFYECNMLDCYFPFNCSMLKTLNVRTFTLTNNELVISPDVITINEKTDYVGQKCIIDLYYMRMANQHGRDIIICSEDEIKGSIDVPEKTCVVVMHNTDTSNLDVGLPRSSIIV